MRRDWKVVRLVLEHVENGDLADYARQGNFPSELKLDEDAFLGHVEILSDAGIIRNADVIRNVNGDIVRSQMNGAFLTMAGHDLLDALRDKPVWKRVLEKAERAGIAVSWEFIKAAIPPIMKELAI